MDCKLVVNLEWKLVESKVEKSWTLEYIQKFLKVIKVEQPMNNHLSTQGKLDPRGGSILLVFKQNLNPSYWCIWCTKIIKSKLKLRKLQPPKVEGIKNSKRKP